MATTPSPQPSFSPRQKWSIALGVTLTTIAAFAILVGINYLSSRYFFKRIYLSKDTRVQLSPHTVSVLKGLTNQVDVTIYYDKEAPLYSDIVNLLTEYQSHTRKLSVKTVDYYGEPSAAQELKAKYKFYFGSLTNRDFIIFDCNGRTGFVPVSWLSLHRDVPEQSVTNGETQLSIHRKIVAFNGEMFFTAKIFGVSQPKPLKAYFLVGHGERSPEDVHETEGYSKFADVFRRNYVTNAVLDNLLGTNTVPLDCNLLVIIGPRAELATNELEKISQYLDQGGRLFALFDIYSTNRQTGLESLLAKWNVRVTHATVHDLGQRLDDKGTFFSITNFAPHEITKPLIGSQAQIEIVLPRPIGRIKNSPQTGADEPQVTELAYSSINSFLDDNTSSEPRAYPLMVAVERGTAKGVLTDRGSSRMIIAGDSLFLNNQMIDAGMNQDFAESAINWLLNRTTFLSGIGPRPVSEYRLLMSPGQTNAVKGLLLGAIPGGILLFGGLVWLRRRK